MTHTRELLFGCALFALLDVSAAHLLRSTPLWGPEAIERRYRVGHAVYHHDLAPSVELLGTWGGTRYPVRTNDLGFRDATVRHVPLETSQPRLLLMGDSFTEGVGVPFPDTYGGLLQERLGERGIEVLNAAVMSYSPSIYYRKMKFLLEDTGLRVDWVVVALDLSDIGDEARQYRMDESDVVVSRPAEADASLRNVLKQRSLLFHVLDMIWDAAKVRAANPAGYADWTTDAEQFRDYGAEGLALAAARMDDLHELLARRGIGMALVVYPYPAQVARRDSASTHVRFWREWAAERDVPFFDLFPVFMSAPGSPAQVIAENFIAGDVHWSARGHRLVSTALLRQGLANLLTPAPPPRP